jgi:hypothetical protein
MAYCVAFPHDSTNWGNATAVALAAAEDPAGLQYWAQVGKAVVPNSRFDNIGWALITVFQIITTENWNNVAYNGMTATSPAAYLWFVVIIVFGNYILLNLFLAILLENFSTSGGTGGNSSANSMGGTLAAAAKTAQLMVWMQDMLEASWFAKVLRRRNKVAAAQDFGDDDDDGGELVAPESQDKFSSQAHTAKAAFQEGEAGAMRGAAFLLEDGAGDGKCHVSTGTIPTGGHVIPICGSFSWQTGPRGSAATGYPMAAARRRWVLWGGQALCAHATGHSAPDLVCSGQTTNV